MKYTIFYFQPDDMQKDLVTLDNEQKEEDFEKEFEELLKGFIEKEFDSDEDLDETPDPDEDNQYDDADTGQRNLKSHRELRIPSPSMYSKTAISPVCAVDQ